MSSEATTAVAVRGGGAEDALMVRSFAEIAEAGALIAASKMFGNINPAAGFMIVVTCRQEQISLMEFRRRYYIIDGAPSMRADYMLAELARRGGKYTVIKRDETGSEIEIEKDGKKQSFSITWESAQLEPFVFADGGKTFKKNYRTPRARMQTMWCRVVSDGVRVMDPGVNSGLYTPEEVADFDDAPRPAGAAPVVLPPDEIDKRTRKAKKVTAEVGEPAAGVKSDGAIADATTCPIGDEGIKGTPWSEMDSDVLTAALESDDTAMTHGHKAEIRLVLDDRKESK
jgi:hypothetical protein